MASSTASSSSSPPSPPATTGNITNLDDDSLAHCFTDLNLHDVCNLAMTCSNLRRAAYSDSIWQRLFRKQWHEHSLPVNGARDMYMARHNAVQQFKFTDPMDYHIYANPEPINHLFFNENYVFFSQGSLVHMLSLGSYLNDTTIDFHSMDTLRDHKARITCMRLFSLDETTLSRGQTQREQSILVTSSCDHSIRLSWEGSCLRCLRGHNGPVLSLSNKLLGDGRSKVLASGGEDGTVRLWSLSSKRGAHALKATLYGHEKPVSLMSVAGHKTSLLVSMARDSKVRVWDTASSSARSSCCVGMTSVPGAPIDMKCHESLLYVASGSSVTAIDLRTMQKVITTSVHKRKLYSFDIFPSKSLICTGSDGRAMLWDIRRNQEHLKPEPIAELDGHCGPVTLLHMDAYKIVTGGCKDEYINVWETETGKQINSLVACDSVEYGAKIGCNGMAVKGSRIVTVVEKQTNSLISFRDFQSATNLVSNLGKEQQSKFWDSMSGVNSDN
ncbi:hypothetical protein TanjilG_04100 [Lupinus angustifolius]|uniref:F-box domain-containing protein n=1 Tax=Lupinus angustifolius TaxID=3871 RepID=A0A4P1RBN6_LUPAN|nr:PREDICTED: uncharacterized protein LOC109354709 [Lupinus angustifolius]OIW06706.1 hypothetical protein TanjilG_04100 [Lupinus angustifolius]